MSKEWKFGKDWKGSTAAAIKHHPDKFDPKCKDKSKLCPYAIFAAMKKKGYKSHYKDQESTLKGEPHKTFKEFLESVEREGFWLTIGHHGTPPEVVNDPDATDIGFEREQDLEQIKYTYKQFDDIDSALREFQKQLDSDDIMRLILAYYGGTVNHVIDVVYWNYRPNGFGELHWNPRFKDYESRIKLGHIRPAPDLFRRFQQSPDDTHPKTIPGGGRFINWGEEPEQASRQP